MKKRSELSDDNDTARTLLMVASLSSSCLLSPCLLVPAVPAVPVSSLSTAISRYQPPVTRMFRSRKCVESLHESVGILHTEV